MLFRPGNPTGLHGWGAGRSFLLHKCDFNHYGEITISPFWHSGVFFWAAELSLLWESHVSCKISSLWNRRLIQGESGGLLNPSQTSSTEGEEPMQGKRNQQLRLDLPLMVRHETWEVRWVGWGGVLSLGGKQVCEVVIRTPWQLLHARAHTHASQHTGINTWPKMPLAETARSTSDMKLKWHSFKYLHRCSPPQRCRRPCITRNKHKERAEWCGKRKLS